MSARDHSDAWVCVDCYFAHHYGARQHDGEWYAGESDTPCDREPLAKLEGYELADNTYPNGDNPEDPDETGEREFSWSTCEGCGSTLGGSRHRLACFDLDDECTVLVEVDGEPSGERIGDCRCGRPIYRSHMAGTIYHATDDGMVAR